MTLQNRGRGDEQTKAILRERERERDGWMDGYIAQECNNITLTNDLLLSRTIVH